MTEQKEPKEEKSLLNVCICYLRKLNIKVNIGLIIGTLGILSPFFASDFEHLGGEIKKVVLGRTFGNGSLLDEKQYEQLLIFLDKHHNGEEFDLNIQLPIKNLSIIKTNDVTMLDKWDQDKGMGYDYYKKENIFVLYDVEKDNTSIIGCKISEENMDKYNFPCKLKRHYLFDDSALSILQASDILILS